VDEERLKRHDLTDAEWDRLAPLLPEHPRQGGRWRDHRMMINVVFFRTRAGTCWRTRYDERECIYQGTVDVASIRIWLRDPVP
jgi:hypothetical protein